MKYRLMFEVNLMCERLKDYEQNGESKKNEEAASNVSNVSEIEEA